MSTPAALPNVPRLRPRSTDVICSGGSIRWVTSAHPSPAISSTTSILRSACDHCSAVCSTVHCRLLSPAMRCGALPCARASAAIEPVAKIYGLGFLPVSPEHYDFLVVEKRYQRPAVHTFFEVLKDEVVRARIRALGMEPAG